MVCRFSSFIAVRLCRYNKTENLSPGQLALPPFTHLMIECRSRRAAAMKPYLNTHDVLDIIEGFSHLSFNYRIFPPVRIKTKPQIFILRRRPFEKKNRPYGTTTVRVEQNKKQYR